MANLTHLRHNVDRALDSVQAGWRNLVDKAAQAITRFHPGGAPEAEDDDANVLLSNCPRWGFLAAEVRESADAVSVRLEVPGMEPEQIDVSVVDDILRVSGEKRTERERSRGNYHLTERAYGRFERSFRLPSPVDAERAEADYRHGVLTLRLPKRNRNRRVRVKSA